MSTYLVGDIHGCYEELMQLLDTVCFSAKHDQLWVTGDLICRGSGSVQVLRFLYALKNSVRIVLGNHDLNLLSIFYKVKSSKNYKDLDDIINLKDADDLMSWLRFQPFVQVDRQRRILMVHAGIFPDWSVEESLKYSKKLEVFLQSRDYKKFLISVQNNTVSSYSSNLEKKEKLRFYVNVFTRMRFLSFKKDLNLVFKGKPSLLTRKFLPWFQFKNSVVLKEKYKIFFGHWSSLNGKISNNDIIPLDTGCCWGRKMTLFRWEDKSIFCVSCKKYNLKK